MGPLKEKHQSLTDMVWYEKWAAFVLLLGILIMGVAPGWLVALIKPATQLIMQKIQQP
jgi:NADH:ubiquinone oxidoreductase subunit 4 (subunit M)